MSASDASSSLGNKVNKYLSLIKFSHTIFALPFAMVGFVLAIAYENQTFTFQKLGLVVLCMVFARSAAMAFNRWLDRKFDAMNPRTAVREIPSGQISSQNALWFVIINCALFMVCAYLINTICFYLSPVAIFVILFYSYCKRFTALCHLVLGVGLGLAPVGAYLAVTGYFSVLPVLLGFAVMTWTGGFDIIYALQDEEFDKGAKLHSIPAALGKRKALMVSSLIHVITAALIIAFGMLGQFNFIFWIGAILFIGMLIYQHLIVKPNDLSRVNLAFGTTNGVASMTFAIFTIISLLV